MAHKELRYFLLGPLLALLALGWYAQPYELPLKVGGTLFLFWSTFLTSLVCAWFLRNKPLIAATGLLGTWALLWIIYFPVLAWTAWSIGGFAP
jgi:hypothetical protein